MLKNIKRLCAANNISISKLGKTLGFGNGTIERWDRNRPSIDKVILVADYFGVTVDELLKEEK